MGGIDDDQSNVPTEGQSDEHAQAPSYEGGDASSGLNGHDDSIADGSRADGDHKPSQASVPSHEEANGTAALSFLVESSAATHSATADITLEPAVSTTEAAVDADKSTSPQARLSELSPDAMETSDPTPSAEEQEVKTQLDDLTATQTNGHMDINIEETQLAHPEDDHPPSPTTSTATLVLPSAQQSAGPSEANGGDDQPNTSEAARVPSANRLSISYAAATRRLVIDAEVVEKLKVFRHEARIEVHMNIEKDKSGKFRGILVSVEP